MKSYDFINMISICPATQSRQTKLLTINSELAHTTHVVQYGMAFCSVVWLCKSFYLSRHHSKDTSFLTNSVSYSHTISPSPLCFAHLYLSLIFISLCPVPEYVLPNIFEVLYPFIKLKS